MDILGCFDGSRSNSGGVVGNMMRNNGTGGVGWCGLMRLWYGCLVGFGGNVVMRWNLGTTCHAWNRISHTCHVDPCSVAESG